MIRRRGGGEPPMNSHHHCCENLWGQINDEEIERRETNECKKRGKEKVFKLWDYFGDFKILNCTSLMKCKVEKLQNDIKIQDYSFYAFKC